MELISSVSKTNRYLGLPPPDQVRRMPPGYLSINTATSTVGPAAFLGSAALAGAEADTRLNLVSLLGASGETPGQDDARYSEFL